MDRERVGGKRRGVVRRGRKHTRALQKVVFGEIFSRKNNNFPIFRVLVETLKYFVLVKDPLLPPVEETSTKDAHS